ncbi:hypothetical protein HD554DRAFT_2041794 [Boletus coccyginus]|nr:hypothetical protein HD554DRAFT_2041794 [Boletus coccyginus]
MDNFFTTLEATNGYGSTEDEVGFEARGMDKDKSKDENNVSAPSMEELYARCPQAAVDKCTKPKAVKLAKNAIHSSNNTTHSSYDPDTYCEDMSIDHLWQAFKWICFDREWGQPSLLKDGEQDSNFWIIVKAKADVAIKWSDDWDESPQGADQRTPRKMEMRTTCEGAREPSLLLGAKGYVQPVPQMPANGPGNHVSLETGMPDLQGLGFSGGYGYPGVHSVNIVLLPWGETTALANQPQIAGAQQQLPLSDTTHPGPQHMGMSSGSNSQSHSTSPVSMAPILLIPNWLIHLDQHPERNQDDVVFVSFESTFKEKEFLGVTTGTAVSIKDYANEDLKAVRAGKLVIA